MRHKLEDCLQCVHPLLVRKDGPEAYAKIGTGFFIAALDRLFLLSASHCFSNSGYRPDQLAIVPRSRCREFVKFDRIWTGRSLAPDQKDQTDKADFVVLNVNFTWTPDHVLADLRPFRLTPLSCIDPTNPDVAEVIVCGYPGERAVIDNLRMVLEAGCVVFDVAKRKPDSSREHLHLLHFTPEILSSPAGLSGSPVFALRPPESGDAQMSLAGIVVLGGTGMLGAIDGRLIESAIGHILNEEDEQEPERDE